MDESVVKHLERADRKSAAAYRLLLRAAQIIEEGGHCKGRASDGTAHCLSGAVSSAALETGDVWDLYNGHNVCFERIRGLLEDPIGWNDAPERTAADVAAKLRAAALLQCT